MFEGRKDMDVECCVCDLDMNYIVFDKRHYLLISANSVFYVREITGYSIIINI